MSDLSFFRAEPIELRVVAAEIGAALAGDADAALFVRALAPLRRAGRDELAAYDEIFALDDLRETRAGACLVAPTDLPHVPRSTAALVVERPLEALARLAARLHPASSRPGPQFGDAAAGAAAAYPSARVAGSARLESGVIVDPGACIGPGAEIGAGTFVGAGSLVGAGVRIGRQCAIDAGVTLVNALLGDRVTILAGARLGHADLPILEPARPSLGRVILQNDVVIGANAIVPRGVFDDTIVGEGARLAALAIVAADSVVARGAIVAPYTSSG